MKSIRFRQANCRWRLSIAERCLWALSSIYLFALLLLAGMPQAYADTVTTYDFQNGTPGVPGSTIEVHANSLGSLPSPTGGMTESFDFSALYANDGDYIATGAFNNQFVAHRFTVKISEAKALVSQINIQYDGSGVQGKKNLSDGIEFYIYDYSQGGWASWSPNSGNTTADYFFNRTISTNASNYVGGTNNDTISFIVTTISQRQGNFALTLYSDLFNLTVTALDPPHHYEIEHDAAGSTCADESVTLKACVDASCSSLFPIATSMDLKINGVTETSTTFTGSTTVSIDHKVEETVTFSLGGYNIPATSGDVCDDGSGSSCDMAFVSTGCSTLEAHYLFNENSGQTTADSSGNGRHGTFGSTTSVESIDPTWACDAYVKFKKSSNQRLITSSFSPPATGVISFWMRPKTLPSSRSRIWGFGDGYEVRFESDGYLYLDLGQGGSDTSMTTNSPISTANAWVHFTFVTNATDDTWAVYKNGVLENSGSATLTAQSAAALTIGGSTWKPNDESFDGYIEDFRIYSGELTVAQIAALPGTTPTTCVEVDHYRIEHDGTGLTCLSESITVKACEDASCTNLSSESVTGTLTSTGTQPTTALSFSSGSQAVSLGQTSAGGITLALTGMLPEADNAVQCLNTATMSSSCNMSFADAGYLVSIPDFVARSKAHAQTNGGIAATVQAVQTDNSQNCAPAYTGNQSVDVALTYVDPNSGSQAVAFSADDSTYVDLTTTINTTLNFSAGSSTANFYLAYPDAGQLRLTFTDPNNVLINGGVATGSDDFVARPDKLEAKLTDLSDANLAGGTYMAGRPFKLTINALNLDGAVTANYQPGDLELNPTMIITMPGAANATTMYYSASGSISATKSDNWSNASLTFTNGVYSTSVASFDDVGEFQLDVRDTNYFSSSIGSAGVVSAGRFTPAYFDIQQIDAPSIADTHANDFSYIGESLSYETSPKYKVVAKNYKDATTTNYHGSFNQFTGANAFDLSGRLYSENNAGVTIFDGGTLASVDITDPTGWDGEFEFSLSDTFLYTKDATEVAPINVDIELELQATDLTDADGIGYDANGLSDSEIDSDKFTIASITGTQVRYGRLSLDNAFGPETQSLKVPAHIEYWNGTRFIANADDDDSSFSAFTGTLTGSNASDFSFAVRTPSSSTFTDGGIPGSDGLFVDTSTGSTISELVLELGTYPSHLQFDWDNDDDIDANDKLTTNVIFGRYRGNDRIIFKRER